MLLKTPASRPSSSRRATCTCRERSPALTASAAAASVWMGRTDLADAQEAQGAGDQQHGEDEDQRNVYRADGQRQRLDHSCSTMM